MKHLFAGKRGALAGLLLVAGLLAGAMGWATRASLRLERERLEAQARAEHSDRLRLALWRLDSRMTAFLAREESRPFNHYSAVFAPTLALDSRGQPLAPGAIIEPSPLLGAELPEWVLLHFQGDAKALESPQVLAPRLASRLRGLCPKLATRNVTPERARLLRQLRDEVIAPELVAQARRHAGQVAFRDRVLLADERSLSTLSAAQVQQLAQKASPEDVKEWVSRKGEQSKLSYGRFSEVRIDRDVALTNLARNGEEWLSLSTLSANGEKKDTTTKAGKDAPAPSSEVVVSMSPMVGLWLKAPAGPPRLMLLRLVRLGEREAVQGILLDGTRLGELLADEVQDLFPEARLVPERTAGPDDVSVAMTALPFRLDPGPTPPAGPIGWSALRIGLALAWAALGVALAAAALGGRALLDLSERRFRFVSAVTHELRTPLTTLRLYIDLMQRGVVSDGPARSEYLATMSAETDRLAQLISNVLDYSRLEGQRGRAALAETSAQGLLEEAASAWKVRCQGAGKELVVESALAEGEAVRTDAALVGQVLGNLLENACKYSRDAADRRLWLRARREGERVVFEVEDRGPGVPPAERESIFRPFHRGSAAGAATGGVGLGLALARRWAELLGGRLTVSAAAEGGACFRLELPG